MEVAAEPDGVSARSGFPVEVTQAPQAQPAQAPQAQPGRWYPCRHGEAGARPRQTVEAAGPAAAGPVGVQVLLVHILTFLRMSVSS